MWEIAKAVGFMVIGAVLYRRFLEGKLGGDVATVCRTGQSAGAELWAQAGWK